MKNEIIEYVRNKKNNPVGCLVAKKAESGSVYIGWSKYAESKEVVEFCKSHALFIARGRRDKRISRDETILHHMNELAKIDGVNGVAIKDQVLVEENKPLFPFAIDAVIDKFVERCRRYFRTDDIVVI